MVKINMELTDEQDRKVQLYCLANKIKDKRRGICMIIDKFPIDKEKKKLDKIK